MTPAGAGVAVYQVKSFSSNLTAGQKAQAERSFRRLLDYARGHGLHVTEWYLTLPLDPTNDNLEWLSGFTAGPGITAEWRGLGFLEGLAGTYPALIDYYLRDGKDRLQAALDSITTVLRTTLQLGPAATAQGHLRLTSRPAHAGRDRRDPRSAARHPERA